MENTSNGNDPSLEQHIERLKRVYYVASKSPDPRTQVGSVLYDCIGNFLGEDCNHPIVEMDIAGTLARYKDAKKFTFEHSERNVLFNAIERYGFQAVRGSTLYTNWMPCADCARVIARFGVGTLVIDERNAELTDEYWLTMFDWAETQLLKRGVMVVRINEEFSHTGFLFDGRMIKR